MARLVLETGRPGRIEGYPDPGTSRLGIARGLGWLSSVGTPVIVEGRTWGVMGVGSTIEGGLPADTEERLVDFTELLALAIVNAESRDQITRLAEEQAALRRVATLVAKGASQADVFTAVAQEVSHVVHIPMSAVARYDDSEVMTVAWSPRPR